MTRPDIKEIVFINQDSGYLMIDIVNGFDDIGIKCTLIAGRIVERNISLNPSVRKVKIIKYNRRTNLRRIISWIVGTMQCYFLMAFRYRKAEIFIVSNPPFAQLLPLFCKNRFSLMVFDVYPNALVEFGIVSKKSVLNRIWEKANRKVFSRALRVYTLTSGMKQALEPYVSSEKIKIVPLWTNNEFLKPIPKDQNPFIEKHHLQNKFIVLYSGNFGRAHHIDTIIDLASEISDEQIMFVIIGDGPEKEKIRKKAEASGLKNCLFLPWQEPKQLPFSLSSSDLAIVSLAENASKLGIPSKLFNYMSVGAPVLCITSSDSELEKLVREYKIGKSFSYQMQQEMIEYITELNKNPHTYKQFSKNSLKASLNHTVKNVDLIRFDHYVQESYKTCI
jgi:glycosyltransferase involved in cell wall biosynthesis